MTSASFIAVSGVVSAGLSTTVLPVASAGAIFHAAISSGKFHGNDLSRHAQRPRGSARKGIFQFVRPAGVIKKMGGRQRNIHIARFADRLAAVHRFDDGEFACPLLENAGDAINIFAPLLAGHFRPDFVVCAARRLDGLVHVFGRCVADFRQLLFSGRIDRGEIFSLDRRNEFAVDEQIVSRGDRHLRRSPAPGRRTRQWRS